MNEGYLAFLYCNEVICSISYEYTETSWGLLHQDMSQNKNPQSGDMYKISTMMLAACTSSEENP